MALLTKIKQAGTQAGLDSTKASIDIIALTDSFTINGKNIRDIGDTKVLKMDSESMTFDFEGTGQKYIHLEIFRIFRF